MPDKNKKFHDFALRSILFKGRSDWYFCFLKAERIAHVLLLLRERSSGTPQESLDDLIYAAEALPQTIAHFVAGELELPIVIADTFGLLSSLRLAVTEGLISKENGAILASEYEQLVEKLGEGHGRLSPFVSADDFTVPGMPEAPPLPPEREFLTLRPIKDNKGHKGHTIGQERRGNASRTSLILNIVRKNKGVSIKTIAAGIKGCSEKTIQRELSALVEQGFVQKQGERRWSLYFPA